MAKRDNVLLPRLLRILGPLALGPVVIGSCAFLLGVRVVWTESLPRGLYWVHPGTIKRDIVVSACLPPRVARFGVERGYLPEGNCPGGAGGVAKVVAGVAGDVVRVDAGGVFINGQRWPWSAPTGTDWSGRPLRERSERYRVRPGNIVLMGLNPHSWDARYFGPIPNDLVAGIATPLLIESGPAAEILRTHRFPPNDPDVRRTP